MEKKYFILISLIMCVFLGLSAASASEINTDDSSSALDDSSLQEITSIQSPEISEENIVDEDVQNLKSSEENNDLKLNSNSNSTDKIKAIVKATYKNKTIYVTVVDENNAPLKNVNVHLDLHASYTGHLIKIADAKTNSKGQTSFDVGNWDLRKPAKYFADVGVYDDKYDSKIVDMEYTISKKGKMGVLNNNQKSIASKNKLNNNINNHDINMNNANNKSINMESTGIPILGLLLGVLVIIGVRFKKD